MNQFTFYWQLIANVVILIIAIIIGLAVETTDTKRSQFTALVIGLIVSVIFITEFWFFGTNGSYWTAIVPFVFLLIVLNFIAKGGNSLSRGTVSGLLHRSDESMVKVLTPGSSWKNWGNPLTTHITADPDGEDNSAADIQKIPIRLERSADFRTKESPLIGLWRAHVNEVYFYFEPIPGMLEHAINIAGGARTIEAETKIRLNELLEHFIGDKLPEDFDARQGEMKDELEIYLFNGIEEFLAHKEYPFRIANDEIEVGSTELEDAYYEAKLAQSKNRIVQKTADETARALSDRIKAFKDSGFSEETFLVGTGVVKKNVEEKNVKTEVGFTKDTTTGIAEGIVKVINALK